MATAVSMWPDDLFVENGRTPFAILKEQADALAEDSGGRIIAELAESTVDDTTQVDFEIVAPSLRRRHRAFSIRCGVDAPYPVEILPPDQHIAKGLQTKVIVEPGRQPMLGTFGTAEISGKPAMYGPNPWFVGDEAAFVKKLKEVLNHPATRGVISSFLALISEQSSNGTHPDSSHAESGNL